MKKYSLVNDAVLAFLRSELEQRYLFSSIQRFRELRGISPEVVDAFREFALRRVYPAGRARAEIDEAFSCLHELLRSPVKMASLGPVAVTAVWRLGQKLPTALSAAQQVSQAFSAVSAVERALCAAVLECGLPWQSGLEVDDMKAVFGRLPAELSEAIIAALVHLLELAANRETMETGLGLLKLIEESISGKPAPWTDKDRHGVALAMATLAEAADLFSSIDDRDIPRFIKGIEAVETAWNQTMRAGK